MNDLLQSIGGLFMGPGALGDPRETFKMYAPPNLLDVYTPEQQEAFGKQIQAQMRRINADYRPGFRDVQGAITNAAKTRSEIDKANMELAEAQRLQSDLGQIFGGGIPKPAVMGMTPEANAARTTPAPTGRKQQAQQYFLAAQAMAMRGNGEEAKRYHDIGMGLDPNPSEDIRSLEYLRGSSLAGTGQMGIDLIKSFNESRTPKTNVNLGPENKGEQAYWSALGGRLPEMESQAVAAARTNEALQGMIDLSNRKTFSGTLAPGAIGATQFMNSLGFNIKPETLSNTREFQASANILVLDFMGAMGGARGFSKEESAILYDAFPKIIDSPQARERIARMLIARNNRMIRDYNAGREQFEAGINRKLPSPRIEPLELGSTGKAENRMPIRRYNPETGAFEEVR
jgi:hypothetical protein